MRNLWILSSPATLVDLHHLSLSLSLSLFVITAIQPKTAKFTNLGCHPFPGMEVNSLRLHMRTCGPRSSSPSKKRDTTGHTNRLQVWSKHSGTRVQGFGGRSQLKATNSKVEQAKAEWLKSKVRPKTSKSFWQLLIQDKTSKFHKIRNTVPAARPAGKFSNKAFNKYPTSRKA